MAPKIEDQHAYWTNLAQQATAGELRMELELGEALRAAAKKYAERLDQLLIEARRLGKLSGWGSLPSAIALRTKFEHKAVGGGSNPDDNAVSRLQEHIEIAWLQHDTFAAAIGKLELIDEERAAALRATTNNL
ncbi:hypothetical protein [Nocardia sp. CNY236]|uniref:hypothetical protein n=1 Tax=Nocardia sp. CNY236 TaxID=1169152 RepID=UPI000423C911|nr:hypothetical protein [Nocardia sp. CNY236]